MYKQKERTNRFISEKFSLFLLGDMFASKRDILALPVRYIGALRQCDMMQIPSRPRGHIARRSLISLPKGISQIPQGIYIAACSPLRITRKAPHLFLYWVGFRHLGLVRNSCRKFWKKASISWRLSASKTPVCTVGWWLKSMENRSHTEPQAPYLLSLAP